LASRVLLDTHILLRWLAEPKRLSRDQARILNEIAHRSETVSISSITLVEMAMLFTDGALKTKLSMDELFDELEANPIFQILPISIEIAKEVSYLRSILRDPADRVIVATARVHGLRLLTSDQRIIESKIVSTIE
jgi:PIN domain nuclease of toxin-antitoxin system